MRLTLRRIAKRDTYTIGHLYIDGAYFCDTCEDRVRDLSRERKVPGETAIPAGTYGITMKVQSPKYRTRAQYRFCDGYLPRLLDVPHFEGVLIHIGNSAADSAGCILVGKNRAKGQVLESTETFRKLHALLKDADGRGEKITITIE